MIRRLDKNAQLNLRDGPTAFVFPFFSAAFFT